MKIRDMKVKRYRFLEIGKRNRQKNRWTKGGQTDRCEDRPGEKTDWEKRHIAMTKE